MVKFIFDVKWEFDVRFYDLNLFSWLINILKILVCDINLSNSLSYIWENPYNKLKKSL